MLERRQAPVDVAGHQLTELKCRNPTSGAFDKKHGTTKASARDLNALKSVFSNPLKYDEEHCVLSDGGREASGDGNWALVGECGNDSAAVWLQSYVSFILKRNHPTALKRSLLTHLCRWLVDGVLNLGRSPRWWNTWSWAAKIRKTMICMAMRRWTVEKDGSRLENPMVVLLAAAPLVRSDSSVLDTASGRRLCEHAVDCILVKAGGMLRYLLNAASRLRKVESRTYITA